jgi:predicted secreted protein
MAACLASALASRSVRAEESSWAFVGFSQDGSFAAVEMFGTRGDRESPYSTIRIIDTKANQFTGPPITTCVGQGCAELPKSAEPGLKEVRTWNRERAREALGRFRIDLNLQGTRNSLSTKQRMSVDQGQGTGGMAREAIQFRWLDADCTLVLQEVPAPNGKDGGASRMIDLRLQRGGTELVLQKDARIPQSRGTGIYSYEMDSMITYGTTLLVVLRYTRPGQRGPEIAQMFVTAAGL